MSVVYIQLPSLSMLSTGQYPFNELQYAVFQRPDKNKCVRDFCCAGMHGSRYLAVHFKKRRVVKFAMNCCVNFIVQNRWLFAIFLLPISFFYDVYWYLRSKWVLFCGSAPGKHKERVEFVQKQVLDWQIHGNGRKMCTARPSWMSITQQIVTYKDTAYRVQVNKQINS